MGSQKDGILVAENISKRFGGTPGFKRRVFLLKGRRGSCLNGRKWSR